MKTASPDDFLCRAVAQADPSLLINDPTISLYCLDDAARRALFVQVPEDIDVTAGPFLYMEQYNHAQRVLAAPYETLHSVAAGVEAPERLVFIHSTGRAGSTLMSKAFGEMSSVTSLSEPDVYTQAVEMRLQGGRDEEATALLATATKLLFNPAFTRGSSLKVVKFRSFSIEIADLLAAAFPHADSLFLYRDLAASILSRARAFGVMERSAEEQHATQVRLAAMAPLLAEELNQRPVLDAVEGLCLVWLSAMHAYARCRRQGMPMFSVRYQDLVANPSYMLATILTYLRLPLDHIQDGLCAFECDAQTGSPIAQEEVGHRTVQIASCQWDLVRALLQRYPVVEAGIPAATFTLP